MEFVANKKIKNNEMERKRVIIDIHVSNCPLLIDLFSLYYLNCNYLSKLYEKYYYYIWRNLEEFILNAELYEIFMFPLVFY